MKTSDLNSAPSVAKECVWCDGNADLEQCIWCGNPHRIEHGVCIWCGKPMRGHPQRSDPVCSDCFYLLRKTGFSDLEIFRYRDANPKLVRTTGSARAD